MGEFPNMAMEVVKAPKVNLGRGILGENKRRKGGGTDDERTTGKSNARNWGGVGGANPCSGMPAPAPKTAQHQDTIGQKPGPFARDEAGLASDELINEIKLLKLKHQKAKLQAKLDEANKQKCKKRHIR